jgi:hypothetical protein
MNEIRRESRRLLLRVDCKKKLTLAPHQQQYRRLLTLGRCIWVRNEHRLHAGHNLLSLNFTIRLNDGQSQWSRPHNGTHLFLAPARGGGSLTSTILGTKTRIAIEFHGLKDTITRHRFRNDACGGGQPVHDVIRALKQIADALQYLRRERADQNPFIRSEGGNDTRTCLARYAAAM